MTATLDIRQPAALRRDGVATRRLILDAGERLFADKGFEGVSVRDITEDCGIDLGLVNYHFRSKENLFRKVLAMRVDEINDARRRNIDAVEIRADDPQTVDDLLTAFLRPFTGNNKAASRRLSSYRRLFALVSNSRRWQGEVIEQHYSEPARYLALKLRLTLPRADDRQIYWALSFLLGAMINGYAETKRIDRLSAGKARSDDPFVVERKVVRFAADGLARLAVIGVR